MARPIPFPKLLPDYHAFKGGLDLVTPRIQLDPGKLFDAQNYEPITVGGYRRVNGHERYDGRAATPSAATYWTISVTVTGTLSAGQTVTGATSAATGRVLGVFGTTLVMGRVSGTFVTGENLRVSGVTQAVSTSAATQRGALMPSDDADWRLLAANDRRLDIGAVPGSGPVRGVFVQNDITYAIRDTVDGVNSILWKATNAGWVQAPLGAVLTVRPYTGIITWSLFNPATVSWTAHGLVNGDAVQFFVPAGLGTVPAGITDATTYYVISATTNTFEITTDPGGAAAPIVITNGGAGPQHCTLVGHWGGAFNPTFVSNQVNVGDFFTGASSGATGTVRTVVLTSGAWGSLSSSAMVVLTGVTGSFLGEAMKIGVRISVAGSSVSQVRFSGGTVETISANFSGSSGTKRTYGADGVNPAFEYDGAVYVPILTGMTFDKPTHIFEFRNYLFLSFSGGSVQFSAVGNPFSWTLVLGAGEIATGDNVTAFKLLAATQAGAALGIFTDGRHYTLYGTSASNFVMVPSNSDIGFAAGTVQQVSNNVYGFTKRGIQAVTTTLNYGDFEFAALSFFIEPLINAKMGLAISSATLKNKNQYRLFFSDGTGLVVGLTGEKLAGILPINYGKPVRCITVADVGGKERCFFGSDDGYVYEDCVGTSFDGQPIEAWIRPAFNNLRSPLVRKQYRRAKFELSCDGYTQLSFGYDLGYANPDVNPPAMSQDQKLSQKVSVIDGGTAFWDQFTWDQFVWDTPLVNTADVPLDGTENNIAFIVYSNRAQDDPHTLQGVNLLYTPRRLVHSGS